MYILVDMYVLSIFVERFRDLLTRFLFRYAIAGTDADFARATGGKVPNMISIAVSGAAAAEGGSGGGRKQARDGDREERSGKKVKSGKSGRDKHRR